MIPGAVVLLHSPLVDADAWGRWPRALAKAMELPPTEIVVVAVPDQGAPTYASAYVAHAATQINAANPSGPLALIAHSGAGPLVPLVAYALRSAHRQVGSYVFLDAGLPRAAAARPGSRLDLADAEDPAFGAELRRRLDAGERFPAWSDADLEPGLPSAADRELVLAAARPQGRDYFTEVLPPAPDWPDAPCGFLQTSEAYEPVARAARLRGWTVEHFEAGHFAALRDPDGLAAAVAALVVHL